MLTTLSTMSTYEANECKNEGQCFDPSPEGLLSTTGTSEFNFSEALDALVTLTDQS